MSDKNILSLLGVILLIIGLINTPGTAWAQFTDWTAVGSTGTVDEADTRLVAFNLGTATLRPGVVGTLDLRYNIVAVDGLLYPDAPGAELGVRYRDNGAAAQVIVHLKRYSLETGVTTTLLTLNSNAFPASANYQLQTVLDCRLGFNFFDFAYFMDVELRKTTTAGAPALAIIQLANVRC